MVEAWDSEEPVPEDVPEPDDELGGAGPTTVTFPGVVALVGSTIDTASPTLTGGRLGLSGTLTVRAVVVT